MDVIAALYGEDPSRVVVSCPPTSAEEVAGLAEDARVPYRRLGAVGARGGRFRVAGAVDLPVRELLEAWEEGLPRLMDPQR
jgi:phosphoribosylformylglycinamidine synthase